MGSPTSRRVAGSSPIRTRTPSSSRPSTSRARFAGPSRWPRAGCYSLPGDTSMILVIDNYDSFTYNIVQYLGAMGQDLRIYRNDKITTDEIAELKPDKIVVSPGPCSPEQAGISVEAIQRFAG